MARCVALYLALFSSSLCHCTNAGSGKVPLSQVVRYARSHFPKPLVAVICANQIIRYIEPVSAPTQDDFLSPFRIPTQNRMGFHDPLLNSLTAAAVQFGTSRRGTLFDVGCGIGLPSRLALEEGVLVVSIDLVESLLERIRNDIAPHLWPFFTPIRGRFPDLFLNTLKPQQNQTNTIIAAKVLHFLSGEELPIAFRVFAHLLRPGGQLFITTGTPKNFPRFLPIYEERVRAHQLFPGTLNVAEFAPEYENHLPEKLYALTPEEAIALIEDAGLQPLFIDYIRSPQMPPDLQHDGKDLLGIVARKP